MGGGLTSHKGHGNGQHKGRPYGLILLLAFGAALFGVMVLHKLRERRVFNLLMEDKNRQLLSLQLLLQKEREYNKEMRRKAEETKAKIYYLRNQKLELDRRLLQMLSTIDSLKDEQKAMESALEENQNQIKLLRDKDTSSRNENPQVIALTATLKQKEAEIEELKHRLIPQVSTDDPSNPRVNMTVVGSMEQKGNTEFSHEEGRRVHGDNVWDGHETKSIFSQEKDKREGFEVGSEIRGGQLQKHENLGASSKNVDSEDTSNYGIDGEKNQAKATDTNDDVDELDKRINFNGELGRRKDPYQESEIQKLQQVHEGGKKLDIDENSRVSRLTGGVGLLSGTKRKRWRTLATNRFLNSKVNSGTDAAKNVTSRRLSKEYKDVRNVEDGTVSEERKSERDKTKIETGLRNEMDDRKANLLKHQNSGDDEDMKHGKVSAKTSHRVEGENAMQRNHDNPLAVAIEDTNANGEANNKNNMDVKEPQKKTKLISADGNETEEDMEFAYEQEPETEADKGDLSTDFMSKSYEKEVNKKETNEPEF